MFQQYSQLNRYRESKIQIRVALYIRCSSDEQKKNGYTIKDQTDYGYMFAKENDLVVVGEYVDEGISATLEIHKRKALAQLIADAKAGKFDIVVFKCIDRFFRNVEEYYTAQKQLRKAGVTWLSIEESDLDPEDPEAIFKINMYLAMAEYEARKTSKRINFNNAMRIKNKQVLVGQQSVMFPWKVVGEHRNRHLAKNEDKADMLNDILNYFETHQSKSKTVAYANIKYGTTMTVDIMTRLLTNTLLYGEYRGVSDYVEPWITKERFDKIQDTLKRNARYSSKQGRTFLFTGLIKCRCCGRNLIGNCSKTIGDKAYISYRCNKFMIEKSCSNSQCIAENKIEKQLLKNLEQYITNEIIKLESIKEMPVQKSDNSIKIDELKKEMARVNNMYRKGRMPEEEYDKEYAILEAELSKIDVEEEPKERNLDGLKELLESDFRTIYDALDREHKKAFWRNTIKEFTLDENKRIVPESIIFF